MNNVNMNLTHLPSDVLCEIIEWTEKPSALLCVCKGLTVTLDRIFEGIIQNCASTQTLGGEASWINLQHAGYPLLKKIDLLRESLIQQIKDTQVSVSEQFDKDKLLQFQREMSLVSIKQLTPLRDWLEDINFLKLCAEVAKKIPEVSVYLESIKEDNMSKKAEVIRQSLSSHKEVLKNVKVLFLMGFSKLPKEIGLFTGLEFLHIHKNNLASLPKEIGKLTALKKLNLRNLELTKLPKEIGNLTKLQQLILDGNRFTSLPPEIGNLNEVQELELYANQITSLPSEMGNLTKLQRLDLNGNQLTSLPPEMGNLTALQILGLSDNKITGLPTQAQVGGWLTGEQLKHFMEQIKAQVN